MNTQTTNKALATSLVRTITPWVVGLVIAGLTKIGLDLPNEAVEMAVTLVISAIYYVGARYLETHADSRFGWLLGLPNAPVYPEAPQDDTEETFDFGVR